MLSVLIFMMGVSAQAEVVRGKVSILKQDKFNSPVVETLAENSKVKVLKKQGIWSFVETPAGSQGWLRNYQITSEKKESVDTHGNHYMNLNEKRVTGVKGLTEENLKNIVANADATKTLEPYRSSKVNARDFASEASLSSSEVEYLEKGK